MRAKIPRVVADANVLWSPQLRNLLLQLAHQDLFRIYWTDLVVEEWLRNLAPEQRTRCEAGTVPLMQRHFPEAWLPVMAPTRFGTTAPKDCHVAAAAAHVAPSVLVTWNLKDFDREALHDHGVEVLSPDRFLIRVLDGSPAAVLAFTRQAQANLTRTAPTWAAYKSLLSKVGLAEFVAGVEAWDARPAVDDDPDEDAASP